MATVAERLQQALHQWNPGTGREPSIRQFQQELEMRSGVRGTTYASVHSYFSGRAPSPPLSFLEAAADILGVRAAWLAFDDGEMTEELETRRRGALDRRGFETYPSVFWEEFDATWIEDQFPNPPSWKDLLHRWALLRFARKLSDSTPPPHAPQEALWEEEDTRRQLLKAAGLFLRAVDDGFEKAGTDSGAFESGILLRGSAEVEWHTPWSDAVLDLFSRQVRGLGNNGPLLERQLPDDETPVQERPAEAAAVHEDAEVEQAGEEQAPDARARKFRSEDYVL